MPERTIPAKRAQHASLITIQGKQCLVMAYDTNMEVEHPCHAGICVEPSRAQQTMACKYRYTLQLPDGRPSRFFNLGGVCLAGLYEGRSVENQLSGPDSRQSLRTCS